MSFSELPKRPMIAVRILDIQHTPSFGIINRSLIKPFLLIRASAIQQNAPYHQNLEYMKPKCSLKTSNVLNANIKNRKITNKNLDSDQKQFFEYKKSNPIPHQMIKTPCLRKRTTTQTIPEQKANFNTLLGVKRSN